MMNRDFPNDARNPGDAKTGHPDWHKLVRARGPGDHDNTVFPGSIMLKISRRGFRIPLAAGTVTRVWGGRDCDGEKPVIFSQRPASNDKIRPACQP